MPKGAKQKINFDEKKKQNPYGVFSETSYISTDPNKERSDPYEKEEALPSRYTGTHFKTNPPKKGRNGDALFGGRKEKGAKDAEPTPDPYLKPGLVDPKKKKEHEEAMKKISGGKDFRYVSPAKKAGRGLGSNYGTISGAVTHEPDYKHPDKDEKPERPKPQKKNIMTRPSKKGTYGMTGQFFSTPATENDKEGKPVTNSYDAQKIKDREEWQKLKKIQADFIPQSFKSTCRTKTFFDEAGASGISKIYSYPRPDGDKDKEEKKGGKKEEKKPAETTKTFVYSSPPKSGWKGCLSTFPNAVDVDLKAELGKLKDVKKREKFKANKGYLEGEWRPVSGVKNGLTKSLLRKFY